MKLKFYTIAFLLISHSYFYSQSLIGNKLIENAFELDAITLKDVQVENYIPKDIEKKGFFEIWKLGFLNERRGDYHKAQKLYKLATITGRFEKPPFEAAFSLARIYMLQGKNKKGLKLYNEYIHWAEATINHWEKIKDRAGPWSHTLEEVKGFNLKIQQSKRIIKHYNSLSN